MKPLIRVITLMLLPWAAIASQGEGTQSISPQEVVDTAASELIEKIKAPTFSFENDEDLRREINQTILPIIDQNLISKLTLGRHWESANDQQKQAFTQGFKALLIDTYVGAFRTVKDQEVTLEYEGTRYNKSGDKAIVRSIIKLASGSNFTVDYRLYNKQGEWQVYDASVEGLGIVKTYRMQFDSQINQQGLDTTIQELQQQHASL